ncbi:MAG TPA: NAD(P)-dependent oxidoreductase [Candidatus Limnocylindria bacterium]|nr:NAD(P)-dependent oxidoreductase [Candidatus Limnocylindria bacterium]
MPSNIAFIGIGVMGHPMAAHLMDAGYSLTLYNRTPSKCDDLKARGAAVAASPADAARGADVVFTMLPDEHAVRGVLLGEGGVCSGARPGTLVINTSTVSPESNAQRGEDLAAMGLRFMDAPVTGSGLQARDRTIVFIASGERAAFDEALPLLRAMGKDAYFAGEKVGSASYAKLCSNAMMAVNLASFSEAVVLAKKAGVDPEMFVRFCSGGGPQSAMADKKIGKLLKRDFSPTFRTALLHKDTMLARALAARLGVPVPALSLVSELLLAACKDGYADEDVCALVKNYERWAGVEVTKP